MVGTVAAQPSMRHWVAVVGGACALLLAVLLGGYLLIRGDLPDQVASHWGTDGVDATSSPASFVAMTAALQVGGCLLLGVVAAVLPTESRQTLGVVAVGMSAFFTVALGGSVFAQRGVTNPHSATVGGWLALGFAAAVPAAGLAWWLLPAVVPPADERREPPSAAADDSPEVVPPWSAPVPAGSGGYVVAGLLALLAVGLATTPARWVAVPVILLVLAGVLAMSRARLEIGSDGIRVRSLSVITWLRADPATIASASADSVSPLGDFGGYGLRYSLRGKGFVTCSGPALVLRVPHGADIFISIADADLPDALAAVRRLLSAATNLG